MFATFGAPGIATNGAIGRYLLGTHQAWALKRNSVPNRTYDVRSGEASMERNSHVSCQLSAGLCMFASVRSHVHKCQRMAYQSSFSSAICSEIGNQLYRPKLWRSQASKDQTWRSLGVVLVVSSPVSQLLSGCVGRCWEPPAVAETIKNFLSANVLANSRGLHPAFEEGANPNVLMV